MVHYYSSYYHKMSYPRIIVTVKSVSAIRKVNEWVGTHGEDVDTLIVDSGILWEKTDDGIERLIDVQKKHADLAVAPDEFEDIAATVEHTVKWYDRVGFDADQCIFPLQGRTPDEYMRCLDLLMEEGIEPEYVGLGGLIVKKPPQIQSTLQLVPRLKKKNLKCHVFGLGVGWVNQIKALNPTSWDTSHAVRMAVDGIMMGNSLQKMNDVSGLDSWERLNLCYWNNHKIERYLNSPNIHTIAGDFS